MSDLPRLVVDREQLRSLRWEGGCPDCQGEGWLDDETRCPCLRSEATVTLVGQLMMPCPQCVWHRDHGEQIFGWHCPFCYAEGSGNRHTVTVPVGTRVEVGWWDHQHWQVDEWHSVATATVAEVLFLHGEDWVIELTDIEAVS